MQSSPSPCDNEFNAWNFCNLSLSEPEPEVVPSISLPSAFHEQHIMNPIQDYDAPMEPAFGFDININTMTVGGGRNIETSSSNCGRKASLKRGWETFRPLAEDIIRRSATLPWDSGPSEDDSQAQRELASLTRGSMRDFGGDQAPMRAACQRAPNSLSPSPKVNASTLSPFSRRSSRRAHDTALSRNVQATTDQVEGIRAHFSGHLRTNACPVLGCRYRQANGRMPDFRRHIKTHFRGMAETQCTNVLNEHGMWIGGCLRTFSRGDALKRHLRNSTCASPRLFPRYF